MFASLLRSSMKKFEICIFGTTMSICVGLGWLGRKMQTFSYILVQVLKILKDRVR
jgi:hypothetical protein